ncbi:hypothetical protein BCV69DRAFT_300605 [Microstroma glucosiphilum]|uniref:Uncharacterized protein n=1 Tax=Pseudomicrostroma glucosiphilum TaxID=1684307 RepID=A0A316U1N1_9BASI|nr:hypothetical protein BCV69DRAFT_300605 [Pseudomicrostroma glucosiphilum]PWN19286.1 hypothetical protein BCV69DRAFT_300605 [Pseudomicrostroma glucosiphilum]
MLSPLRGGSRGLTSYLAAVAASSSASSSAWRSSTATTSSLSPPSSSRTLASAAPSRVKNNQQEWAIRTKAMGKRRAKRVENVYRAKGPEGDRASPAPPARQRSFEAPSRRSRPSAGSAHSQREKRFGLSTKLKQLRESIKHRDPAAVVLEAQKLFDNEKNYVKWNVVTCNQYMDLLCYAGKLQMATQVYIDMKRFGQYPNARTWVTLFRGALGKGLSQKDNTLILSRLESAYADLENVRMAAFGPEEDIKTRIGALAQKQEWIEMVKELRVDAQALRLAYGRWCLILVMLGRHDDAWDIVSRFSGSWEANKNAFPRLSWEVVDLWMQPYSSNRVEVTKSDLDRFAETWQKYTKLIYTSADGVLARYNTARNQEKRDAVVEEWKALIPPLDLLQSFARIAMESKDSRLCGAAFEALCDHTDVFDATNIKSKRSELLPSEMYDEKHPLCMKIRTGSSTFRVLLSAVALNDHSPEAITSTPFFYDLLVSDAKQALSTFDVARPTTLPRKSSSTDDTPIYAVEFMLRRAIIEAGTKVGGDVGKNLLELFSMIRQLHQIGLRENLPDEGHYASAARYLLRAAVRNPQFPLWWLQDRAMSKEQRRSPWTPHTVSCALLYGRMILELANRAKPRKYGAASQGQAPREEDSASSLFPSEEEDLMEDQEYDLEGDDLPASSSPSSASAKGDIQDAAARLYARDEEKSTSTSAPLQQRATLEERALVLDFLRKWKASFAPGEDGAVTGSSSVVKLFPAPADLVKGQAGPTFGSSSSAARERDRDRDREPRTGKLNELDSVLLLRTTIVFARLLNLALDSGAQGADLLAREEVVWLKEFKRRVSAVRMQLVEEGVTLDPKGSRGGRSRGARRAGAGAGAGAGP